MTTEKSYWLIERHINDTLYYWSVGQPSLSRRAQHYGSRLDGWCTDPDAAVRFARREDAGIVLNRLGGNGRVAEHMWVTP